MENLLRQRDELTAKIDELDRLSTTGTEKILQAIKNQRWFFSENNKKVLLDKNTGLIWANLDYFPWEKSDGNSYALNEVDALINEMNEKGWDDWKNWRIPTAEELWKLIEDKTFPFCDGLNWRIKNNWNWCVWHNDALARKDLDFYGATAEIDNGVCHILPCWQRKHLNTNYVTAKNILWMFTIYDFIPIFDDEKTTALYKTIFVDEKLYKLVFFPELFVEQFDAASIEKSPIKYFDAITDVTVRDRAGKDNRRVFKNFNQAQRKVHRQPEFDGGRKFTACRPSKIFGAAVESGHGRSQNTNSFRQNAGRKFFHAAGRNKSRRQSDWRTCRLASRASRRFRVSD